MDILNNFCEKANSMLDVIDIDIEDEQKTNILICVYIISFLMFKPYKATEIAKMPIIQLSIIALTLHIARTNHVTAGLIATAFIVTLMVDTEGNDNSTDTPRLNIEDREKFSGGSPDDDSDDEEANSNDDDDNDDDE